MGHSRPILFTENETNSWRLWNSGAENSFVKDAFHEFVIHGRQDAVNPQNFGTKAAPHYTLNIPAGSSQVVKLRLFASRQDAGDPSAGKMPALPAELPGTTFDQIFDARIREADEFYSQGCPELTDDERNVVRQAYAGLLWSKQFYHYIVRRLVERRSRLIPPPESRQRGRNVEWQHVYSRDVISMPDKWEYPWFAGWDLAFHMIPFASIDPDFAKSQLILFLREWYMHPNGQLPAYEFAFGDVNPPVHAWAAWRVYKISRCARPSRPGFPRECFSETPAEFHLVGQSQRCARQESLLRRLSWAGQHRRVRPVKAGAHRRHIAAGGRRRRGWLFIARRC